MKPLDIGEKIRRKVEEQHWNYSDFARAINCSRSSLYNIFHSRDITLGRLILISKVLDYDFVKDISSESTAMLKPERPFIAIPFDGKELDLSGLPDSILEMIRSKLNC